MKITLYKWGQKHFFKNTMFKKCFWGKFILITNWPWTCPQAIQRPKSKVVFNGDFCNVQGYILEIETFKSHDSSLLCHRWHFFIMMITCVDDQWTVALQERSTVTVPCRANIAIVITANVNTVTVLRDMVIAINYHHIIKLLLDNKRDE